MTGYFQGPRALTADESEPVRALVLGALGVTPYVDRVLALVAAAERGDADSRALVVERDGTVAGLVLYGPVAGTRGTWRLNMILIAAAVDARDVGAAMLDALVDACHGEGARLLVAELPADPVIGTSLSVLRANRFRQEGRIPDYFRDGAALLFLRRDL